MMKAGESDEPDFTLHKAIARAVLYHISGNILCVDRDKDNKPEKVSERGLQL